MTGSRPVCAAASRRLGWEQALPPVAIGQIDVAGASVRSLADLADGVTIGSAHGQAERSAVLGVVHLACRALADVLISVVVADGVVLAVEPDELGVAERPGRPTQSWVTTASPTGASPAEAAAAVWGLLDRVLAGVTAVSGVGPRTVRRIAGESLVGHAHRLRRRVAHEQPDRDLRDVDAFVAGLAEGFGAPGGSITVRPDAGPPLTLVQPRVCCVLSRDLDDGSCPTCPRWPDDDARRAATTAWLASLDEAEFLAVVGRPRRSR